MTDQLNDAGRDPTPSAGRHSPLPEPKGYTKGFRAMVGKRFGYKAARRAGKVWLHSWQEEWNALSPPEGRKR